MLPLVANPGMESCTEEKKNPGPVLSLTNEKDSQKKMWGEGKTIQNTNRSLQNTNREEES